MADGLSEGLLNPWPGVCAFRFFQLLCQQRGERADVLFVQREDIRAWAWGGHAIGKLLHFQPARLLPETCQGVAPWLIVDAERGL